MPRRPRLDAAVAFFRAALAGGPRLSAELLAEAKAAGLHEGAFRRARAELRLRVEKGRGAGKWMTSLPDDFEITVNPPEGGIPTPDATPEKTFPEFSAEEETDPELDPHFLRHMLGPREDVQDSGVVATVGERQSVAVISDTHLGSKYCLRDYLRDFIGYAYSLGVREILHSGDIIDGCYPHSKWEWSHIGLVEQMRDLFEILPQLPGLTYHAIGGNHDETFTKETGVDVPAEIGRYFSERGRHDWHSYGNRGAILRLRGAIIELWHPSGGVAYAQSYKLQKKIESYAPGRKPQILIAGHWHQHATVLSRGVFAFSAGTFQGGGSSFAKSLTGGPPAIGGTILSWELTPDGTMRGVQWERREYYEDERPLDIGAVAR